MIIKASERGGARSLANHLINTDDNEHVELYEMRGVVGQSLHAALLEIEAVSQGTKTKKPLFSVSFNPPQGEDVTFDQFEDAFERVEKMHGLTGQPRAVVFHEKEGRRHAHVVWSRIDIDNMKALKMGLFKNKCLEISKELYLEHNWDMPNGFVDRLQADPFRVTTAEWQQLKRQGINPKDLKILCRNAWSQSDNLKSFANALAERNLFLARGDRRGFVLLDHMGKVYSLSRFGGIKKKELEERLGKPDQLPSVSDVQQKVRKTFNRELLMRIADLKRQQQIEQIPLQENKVLLVHIQQAERKELADQQRVKQSLMAKSAKDRFRRGIRGVFDKFTGRNRRVRLINRRETDKLKAQQAETREKMIFRHNQDRRALQEEILSMRDQHLLEREQLAKRIYELRQVQGHERKQTSQQSFQAATEDESTRQVKSDKARDRSKSNRSRRRGRAPEM